MKNYKYVFEWFFVPILTSFFQLALETTVCMVLFLQWSETFFPIVSCVLLPYLIQTPTGWIFIHFLLVWRPFDITILQIRYVTTYRFCDIFFSLFPSIHNFPYDIICYVAIIMQMQCRSHPQRGEFSLSLSLIQNVFLILKEALFAKPTIFTINF